jgi:CarD family transcriptional regulator
MYKIGDKIMYGANGVMTIVDIRDESFGDVTRSYYVLRPTLSKNESFTFVPTENEQLVSAMRPLLTKDEILSLLHSAKELPPIEWVNENRARQEYFKRIMESGDRAKMISIIRAINESGQRREAEGKKNFITDENAKAKAEKLLYTEFSIVLDIDEEEAKTLTRQSI